MKKGLLFIATLFVSAALFAQLPIEKNFNSDAAVNDGGWVMRQRYSIVLTVALATVVLTMVGIAGASITGCVAIDSCASFERVFLFFQNDDSRAFGHNEAIAVFVERAGSPLRIVIAAAGSTQRGKPADTQHGDGGLGPTGNHDIGIAVLDHTHGFPDGVCARCTGS